MLVKEVIEELKKMDPNMVVLAEYDQDGDGFMIKYGVDNCYVGDAIDDTFDFDDNEGDIDTKYCIIKI